MRQIINFNSKWAFAKGVQEPPKSIPDEWYIVTLPHTWNAIDGQDGGNDYYRGSCCYAKSFLKSDLEEGEQYYLEINGANSSATVYLNDKKLALHDGGYSIWRVNLTDELKDENIIAIIVDNSANNKVYPQNADFTFYGGLYRDVNIICVNKSHFDLDSYGSKGIMVTPQKKNENNDYTVEIKSWVTNAKESQTIKCVILDASGKEVALKEEQVLCLDDTRSANCVTLTIDNATLWNGKKNPYLYKAVVSLIENGAVIDEVSTPFGCRSFEINPHKGFILNGEKYPLRGVSRHQDWWGAGNALTKEQHRIDMDLICEVGATTVRLAHYQHDQYFYDLCDERGIVVWAEIPYISTHMPNARENTFSQMTELIYQSYNHPSIVVWGLSNEITMSGKADEDLIENHKLLNDLTHKLDKTRPTTIACVTMCDINDPYVQIPDTVAYNHYFGWYGGDTSMNGPWFDKFHETFPNIPIGCSEYGCEALNWHTSNPEQGDYTEEYQAYYHEELIKQLFAREYLWATYVWNMFDFGADARNEGGENGQNHKGLVTFDRKYKKDSFYAYKAWLSDEPFVHICGKRYVDRVESVTKITVYSNQPHVELFVNGKSFEKQSGGKHFYYFNVPNEGTTQIIAVSGECTDESYIRKVEAFNEDYRLKEKGAILNWFDITAPKGYYSVNDKICDIMATDEGKGVFTQFLQSISDGSEENAFINPQNMNDMMKMMGTFTVIRMVNMLGMGMTGTKLSKEQVLSLNSQLNQIKKQGE